MNNFKLVLLGILLSGASLNAVIASENVPTDEGDGIVLADLLQRGDKANPADRGGWFSKPSPSALYEQAIDMEQAGHLRRAQSQFKKLLKQAPHNAVAASAQQHLANIYLLREKFSKAKVAYEDLLKNYGSQADYDSALDSLLELAEKQADDRHMKWLFGGFTSPEAAISTLEMVVRYAPATPLAPASQYRIGKIQEENGNLSDAALAYDIVLFRYPNSAVTEDAALSKADCLRQTSENQQNNETARGEAWDACKLFIRMFPESDEQATVQQWSVDLYLARAQDVYNKAVFYETLAFKPEAARIYYHVVINDFSESAFADKAKTRLEALLETEATDA